MKSKEIYKGLEVAIKDPNEKWGDVKYGVVYAVQPGLWVVNHSWVEKSVAEPFVRLPSPNHGDQKVPVMVCSHTGKDGKRVLHPQLVMLKDLMCAYGPWREGQDREKAAREVEQ